HCVFDNIISIILKTTKHRGVGRFTELSKTTGARGSNRRAAFFRLKSWRAHQTLRRRWNGPARNYEKGQCYAAPFSMRGTTCTGGAPFGRRVWPRGTPTAPDFGVDHSQRFPIFTQAYCPDVI